MDDKQTIETKIKPTRESINLETAKIAWKDLEVLYMDVLMLRSHGCERAATQRPPETIICKDSLADAKATVWAIVIKPWVLIQSTEAKQSSNKQP